MTSSAKTAQNTLLTFSPSQKPRQVALNISEFFYPQILKITENGKTSLLPCAGSMASAVQVQAQPGIPLPKESEPMLVCAPDPPVRSGSTMISRYSLAGSGNGADFR